MLEPSNRHLLLDALRPPGGYRLETAVGTTYTLDLDALLIAPVAFAMFDRQDQEGALRNDPVAALQAIRSQAERIMIFCQAGMIAVPKAFRSLIVYLEDSIYPVQPYKFDMVFHPKVWFLKFVSHDGAAVRYRLLCLSRNLTFDRSWDTVLQLDGMPGEKPGHSELRVFLSSLLELGSRHRTIPTERSLAADALARDLECVRWAYPAGFNKVRFWPLGHDGVERWPFGASGKRMLVISPFVTPGMLRRLTEKRPESILVSTPNAFDQLGGKATDHLAERLVFAAGTEAPEEQDGSPESQPIAGDVEVATSRGLHAKAYVTEMDSMARVLTGSANCTHAAFYGNCEFLVELSGWKEYCGIDAILSDDRKVLGLRKLLKAYEPRDDEPGPADPDEEAALRLERTCRILGGLRYVTTCEAIGDGRWRLTLEGKASAGNLLAALGSGPSVRVRPVTLGTAYALEASLGEDGIRVVFDVSEMAVTPYFSFQVSDAAGEASFLIVSDLVDSPAHRADRVLADCLKNRADFIRFLLLLLGDVEDALASFDGKGGSAKGNWVAGSASESLLEPLMRAFSREPDRILEIERAIEALDRDGAGEAVLPERWSEIWEPIRSALAEGTQK